MRGDSSSGTDDHSVPAELWLRVSRPSARAAAVDLELARRLQLARDLLTFPLARTSQYSEQHTNDRHERSQLSAFLSDFLPALIARTDLSPESLTELLRVLAVWARDLIGADVALVYVPLFLSV